MQIEYLNDDPWPDFVDRLKVSRDTLDMAYVSCPLDSQGVASFRVDFESFIEMYFWDTDFLLDPSTFYQLGSSSLQQLGYPPDLFGVLSGLRPHPAELILKTVDEVEATEPENEEGSGEL